MSTIAIELLRQLTFIEITSAIATRSTRVDGTEPKEGAPLRGNAPARLERIHIIVNTVGLPAPRRIIDTTKSSNTRLNYAYLGDLSPYPTATLGTDICIVIAKCIDHSHVSRLRLY